MTNQEKINAEIAKFPETFELWGHPKSLFRVNKSACFVSPKFAGNKWCDAKPETVEIVIQVQFDCGKWSDFIRRPSAEILGEIFTPKK